MNLEQPTVASCGSGVSACWIALAANVALNKDIPVFVVSEYILHSRELLLVQKEIAERTFHLKRCFFCISSSGLPEEIETWGGGGGTH